MLKLLLTTLSSIAILAPSATAQDTTNPLNPAVKLQIEEHLQLPSYDSTTARELRDRIWRTTATTHGELDPLVDDLKARLRVAKKRPIELRLLRLLAHVQRRLGETGQARRTIEKIEIKEETTSDTLTKAEILDALGRNSAAIEAYDRLLKQEISNDLRNRILLRKTLMDDGSRRASKTPATPNRPPRENREQTPKTKGSPLAQFARGAGVNADLRNQAAVILALTGEQAAAIDIFVPKGEGTARFRQELRNAEWAIEAKALPKAQKAAWNAVHHANLKRDRRYALTVLVESYRRADNLDGLIAELAVSQNLDAESREVWIDLLRERGKVDEALKLFRESKKGEFTANMRRELLEICRETNQDKTLENAYLTLVKTEPRFLEWRKGLTSFYLERGRRDEASAVWSDYLNVTEDTRYRMAAAATLTGLGLDELASKFVRETMSSGNLAEQQSALMFLFEMHHGRGRLEVAKKILDELDHLAPADNGIRKELADAHERLGDLDKSVAVLTNLRSALGDRMTPDTRMKLALMLSKIGDEEAALEQWQSLWLQTNSIPRRRYVEERLMTVASRLGTLAKLAIALEKKLNSGTADDREAGLLVRLYIKVSDPVSATEIIEEHMRRSGKKPIDVLTEKARVFQSCQDYYNYEQVIAELLKVDPDGRPDYLRQLAMSMMERGQRKEARDVLEQLKDDKTDAVSDEFEAGVLSLAGMHEEALQAYRRGITRSPERIDTYLLLSNMQRTLGLHTRSAGMFQYLTATAERDDLFTIAVDGILNMRAARDNAGVPDRIVEWTRRAVFERLASRPNKLYLYRLIADLSEELNDSATAIRSLKSALPVAGEQRTQMLRELMAMAKNAAGGNARPTLRVLPSGMLVPVTPRQRKNSNLLMFGRRILGQAEIVPPDVYIELGAAFLASGEVANAIKTFNQASRLPEFAEMRRRMAQSFEVAGYPDEALRVYERILSVENRDVELITKVGELREQTGSDAVALDLYRRGLRFLLDRSVFATTGNKDKEPPVTPGQRPVFSLGNRNSDEWGRQYHWLLTGLLATMSEPTAKQYLQEQTELLDAELQRVRKHRELGEIDKGSRLSHHPRIARRSQIIRRITHTFRQSAILERVDRDLLSVFDRDSILLDQLVRDRLAWGNLAAAQKLVVDASKPGDQRKRLQVLTGTVSSVEDASAVSVAEATNLIFPLLSGDNKLARKLLERVRLAPEDKTALEHIPMLVGATSFVDAPDLTLSFCRHWIDLAVRHSPNLLYQTVQAVLETGRRDLDKSQMQSLTEHVLTLVIEQPDKFTVFVQRLSQLRDTVGPNFLTRQQIEKLIKARLAANDRFIFGVEQMIVMLPVEDRSPVLRSIWNKLPKTQKAYFVVRLIEALDAEVGEEFANFLIAGLRGSIDESDQKASLSFQIEQLSMNALVNYELRLRCLDVFADKGLAGSSLAAGRAALLFKIKKPDQARKHLRTIMEAVTFSKTGRDPTDPRANLSYNRLMSSMGQEIREHVMDVFADIEKERGRSAFTVRKLIALRRQMRIDKDSLAILEKAVEDYPAEKSFRALLATNLKRRGFWKRALEVQESALDAGPGSAAARKRLVTAWKKAHHPIRALKIRDSGAGTGGKRKPPSATPRAGRNNRSTTSRSTTGRVRATPTLALKGRLPLKRIPGTRMATLATSVRTSGASPARRKQSQAPVSIAAVKKAWQKQDEKGALTIFRKFWRIFSPTQSDPYSRSILTASRGRFGAGQRIVWPPDTKPALDAKNAAASKAARERGGLPEIFTRALTSKDHEGHSFLFSAPDDKTEISAQSILVKTDAGREEIQRLLRSLPPNLLDSAIARDIYKALVDAAVADSSRDVVLEKLLAEERAGTSDKLNLGQLTALLSDPDASSPEQLVAYLPAITKGLNPRDEAQLRRVARLHARCGQQEQAATLFQWCAVVKAAGGRVLGLRRQSSTDDLLGEVRRTLDGQHRIRALDSILKLSDPGEFARNTHLEKVLNIWLNLLGPQQCLEHSRWALELVTDFGMRPMRSACKVAAIVHARGGEPDQAVRCLEIALCKLPPPKKTAYPHYLSQFEIPGFLSHYDMARLFPKDVASSPQHKVWLSKASKGVLQWHAAKRLPPDAALSLMAILAIRLHDAGLVEQAAAMLAPMTAQAGDSPNNRLMLADVVRILGKNVSANAIELQLLEQGQLHVERIPDLVVRTLARDGAAAGFALGEKASQATLHPRMLEALIAAAVKTNNAEAKERWEKLAADAAAARAKLDPPKPKPKIKPKSSNGGKQLPAAGGNKAQRKAGSGKKGK